MILAIDVHYQDNKAKAVAFAFADWRSIKPDNIYIEHLDQVAPYVPGQFYQRELPCIKALLNSISLDDVATIVIDGYVLLDDEGKYGLGGYLYDYLNQKINVIGVAKHRFHNNTKNVIEIHRGQSINPLFITSLGVANDIAANCISVMQGPFRMPTLLQQLDRQTKT